MKFNQIKENMQAFAYLGNKTSVLVRVLKPDTHNSEVWIYQFKSKRRIHNRNLTPANVTEPIFGNVWNE